MKDVKLILYPECRHELLNELNRDEVMNDVLSWMTSKIPE
jgi:alpha-beta hydrolase superfamily lysophospholipase